MLISRSPGRARPGRKVAAHPGRKLAAAAATVLATALSLAPSASAVAAPAHATAPATASAVAAASALGAAQAAPAAAVLAPTPPMGWNDWAHYQCGYTESTILDNARALVSTGLAAKGYDTVTIDDCWMEASRDSSGNLVADPTRFPDGMAYVGTQLHALGLKFGIYEDAGTSTCGGYAGSWNHRTQDADLFASWGVDYLKLDGCNLPNVSGQTTEQTYQSAYQQMSQALKGSGRPIVFSESAPAYFQGTNQWTTVLGWVGQYGQLWREGYDIATYDSSNPNVNRFSSVLDNYGYNNQIHRYEHPGNWNDPDFVIAGDGGMTAAQSQSQISLWAEMGSPMNLSDDVGALSAASVAQLGNTAVIAVDQDSLGSPGYVVSQNGTEDVLTRPLANGDRAVAILNRSGSTVTASTSAAAIGFAGGTGCTYKVTDLWAGTTSTSTGTISATIPSDDTAMFRVTPAAGCGTAVVLGQVTGISNLCLDDSGSGTANGTPIIDYTCGGTANQQWTVPTDGTVRTLGECLDVPASATASGTAVDLHTCDGSLGQQWTYNLAGELINPHSGYCLSVAGSSKSSGAKTEILRCGVGRAAQTWSLP